MNWLFADKDRMFWALQTAGWIGFVFLHVLSVSSLVAGWSIPSVAYSIASSLVGFLTTSIVMRPAFRLARRQHPALLLTIALGTTFLLAVAMSAIKAQTFGLIFGDAWMASRGEQLGTDNFLLLLRPDVPANLFLLLSWGGFYFGINYYLTLRHETENALQSARLADQAQLKMLRYQLNPHFLFNTLNAISTLVLTKDGAQANKMLTQLSAFLRYSLDSDPLQRTTLAEELRALQLYLDIEKTRFGDRLTVDMDVDEELLDARVPSLILQPAIENAIKYAIAKMESGGVIRITAKREGEMVRLQVCDNGPETPGDLQALLNDSKTGVGLVNMRDRLAHLYGPRQSFSVSTLAPTGLCVSLKLPIETRKQLND
jgi:signal transduction histidine kinase